MHVVRVESGCNAERGTHELAGGPVAWLEALVASPGLWMGWATSAEVIGPQLALGNKRAHKRAPIFVHPFWAVVCSDHGSNES